VKLYWPFVYCQQRGALIVGLLRTPPVRQSVVSLTGIHIYAGPEIGVASTKACTYSQFISLVMFVLMMCEDRISVQRRRAEIIQGLKHLQDQIKKVLSVEFYHCR